MERNVEPNTSEAASAAHSPSAHYARYLPLAKALPAAELGALI